MKHPEKWRETVDPFSLPYKNFTLINILGYPHAGNDVFHALGNYYNEIVEVYIKVARQIGANLINEARIINKISCPLAPKILELGENYLITFAKFGERLSTIVGDNEDMKSMDYMYKYGQSLAKIHKIKGSFDKVKDWKFFHIPDIEYMSKNNLLKVHQFLLEHKPSHQDLCFCHGDFHYANIKWDSKNKEITAILDFELAGIGIKEFDIAWAIFLREGQRFLKTDLERNKFLEGYSTINSFEIKSVKYYLVLIYSHFYGICHDSKEYIKNLEQFLIDIITEY